MSLFAELKRRNVFRVAIAYIVLAWIVMQVGDTLAPALRLPDSVNSVLAFFLILGFPLAVFFAWAFELTPEGIKLEKHVDRTASITSTTGRKLDYTIIAMLTIAVVYFAWQSRTEPDAETLADSGQSIAVLPFENMSSDAEQEYFSDGLAEELLNLLAKIPELRVSSRTSAFSYKGKDFKISDVGRELNVDHVLEGSVRKSGNKVRITAQLIQTDTDVHMWSETWDRDLDDVFVIQDEIAKAVVDELKVRLLGDIPHAVAAEPEAYSLYLQARHGINQRTHESLKRSEELALRAVDIDPGYAPAWLLLSDVYGVQASTGVRLPDEAYPLAKAAVLKALQLDPNNGRAHAALAGVLAFVDRDFAAANREIDLALELDSGDADTLGQAATIRAITGNPTEGVRLGLEAIERDPLGGGNYWGTMYSYLALGQPDEAIRLGRELAQISPSAAGTHYYLAIALIQAGRRDEALRAIENETLYGFKLTGRAIAYFRDGNRAASDTALAELLAIQSQGWDYQVAIVHAVRGEIDESIAALNQAYRTNDAGSNLMLADPFLENIRSDARYDALVEEVGIRLYP